MSVKVEKPQDQPQLLTSPHPQSQFTYKNLRDLNNPKYAYLSPLSAIALVDLNAFFAQVETIRLGLTEDVPVVCQQWKAIIAVSYAARKFGINRMDTVESARAKCPDLVCAHAGVYKKGEKHWAYEEGQPDPINHKVSLDNYRRESRKILRIIQSKFDLAEKASVDESYVDLGRPIYEMLLSKFPELKSGNSNASDDEILPSIPSSLPRDIQWRGTVIESEKETADPQNALPPQISDWDDVVLAIGSELLLDLRQAIYDELGYTTSAGLARNKLVAKLGGGFKKPDDQTIVRNCALTRFLNNFELTDFTGMGGKLGEQLINRFEVPPDRNSIAFIRENYDLNMIKEEIKEDQELALKLYRIVRGLHPSELTNKVEIKSMMSTKNFLGSRGWSLADAYDWLTVFSGDLSNRLADLDNESMELSTTKLSNKEKGVLRRPKTITIGVRSASFVRQTRQMPISFYKDIERMRESIKNCGFQLLRDYLEFNSNISILNNGTSARELYTRDPKSVRIMDMHNLSLTISNFVALNDSALIESFAKTGKTQANKELMEINAVSKKRKIESDNKISPPVIKKPHKISLEQKENISKLFHDYERGNMENESKSTLNSKSRKRASPPNQPVKRDIFKTLQKKSANLLDSLLQDMYCPRCKTSIEDPVEHNDFHIAMELSTKWNN
ncbi:eso1 [Candida theae]|uniref:DNA polymerase eta n=1 Tax=Candida theae TaxID=1198502 RepID=A0AAD5FY22_9ASCO|nr:eso1 [Candida theae]KAI5957666.1 eso1 [Candida theae]